MTISLPRRSERNAFWLEVSSSASRITRGSALSVHPNDRSNLSYSILPSLAEKRTRQWSSPADALGLLRHEWMKDALILFAKGRGVELSKN